MNAKQTAAILLISVALIALLGCVEEPDKGRTAACVGEGQAIPVIAEPPECCSGLTLIPPKEAGIIGIMGYCCREECLPPAPPYCPSGTVMAQDQTDNCNCPLTSTCCGNESCEGSETAENCPADCQTEELVGPEYYGSEQEAFDALGEELDDMPEFSAEDLEQLLGE